MGCFKVSVQALLSESVRLSDWIEDSVQLWLKPVAVNGIVQEDVKLVPEMNSCALS